MKTLQDYIEIYRSVARNLGYTGQSAEVLVQMCANMSYLDELESATFMKEASLEKCTLPNSKIQHCMDLMYSVYRGECPRVILKIRPKTYFTLNPYDEVISSQNFKVYYLGYYKVEEAEQSYTSNSIDISFGPEGEDEGPQEEPKPDPDEKEGGEFIYGSQTFYPSEENDECSIIICLLAKETSYISKPGVTENRYFIENTDNNLSEDFYIIDMANNILPKTREFYNHILDHSIFDLTITDFGSRLYLIEYYNNLDPKERSNLTTISAMYFKYSRLQDYNQTELERLDFKNGDLVKFDDDWLLKNGYVETKPGVIYVKETDRDALGTIHYKANRNRFTNSILRSNSDIGTVLEETFPSVVKSGGTSYQFSVISDSKSTVDICYIPQDPTITLSKSEIDNFIQDKRAYYVITDVISIEPGIRCSASFFIDLELYSSSITSNLNEEIGDNILKSGYEEKFNVYFNEETLEEIRTLISKISNVKKVGISVVLYDENGEVISLSKLKPNLWKTYFEINYSIRTIVNL